MKKKYTYFLFDLDDTLLNFKESEKLSFFKTLEKLGINNNQIELFDYYQIENNRLWKEFELGVTTKENLKTERFKIVFEKFNLNLDEKIASQTYLDMLPETVVLLDNAINLLEKISNIAKIGIITNGIEYVQYKRIQKAGIQKYLEFICVSESCGFAKPDIRFFDHADKMSGGIDKEKTLVIGDRYDADILGAKNYGLDSCWFNHGHPTPKDQIHTYEIHSLKELEKLIFE